ISIQVMLLFGESDARCADRTRPCDNPEGGTTMDHGDTPGLMDETDCAVPGASMPVMIRMTDDDFTAAGVRLLCGNGQVHAPNCADRGLRAYAQTAHVRPRSCWLARRDVYLR